ncbi:MAG: esterase-like activity of phytase family protein [Bacteroidota bacterium]|nr:esterase-like activity of phytase family protein [Bacteroidota bacterium]
MIRKLFILALCASFFSCAVSRKIHTEDVSLHFQDEYIIPPDLDFKGTRVGGLSGIDYADGEFYFVCDQSSNPRIYSGHISIENQQIDSVYFDDLIQLQKEPFPNTVFDLESVRKLTEPDAFLVTSEGYIENGSDPGIYKVNTEGKITTEFKIPNYFTASGTQKPRNNGVFEGVCKSYDGKAYWVAMELPLEKDGAKPKIYPTHSHVRFTKYDAVTGLPVRQFVYKLDGIAKLPINFFAVNGVTELLEYAPNRFLVLERAYSAGYGSNGNTVKIFEVDATEATNTLEFQNLKKASYQKAHKSLIFNFKHIKDQMKSGIIDNIEGMCFGPEMNGKPSLLLVSDNNFNSFAEQVSQILLFTVDFKNKEH